MYIPRLSLLVLTATLAGCAGRPVDTKAVLDKVLVALPELSCPLVTRQALETWVMYRDRYVPQAVALVTGDPVADEQSLFGRVAALGFAVVYRDEPGGPATTLPGLLILPKNYPGRDVRYRAALLAHELTHALWERDVGIVEAAKVYAWPGSRIGVELPAYEAQGAALQMYGVTLPGLVKHWSKVAPNLYEKYELAPFVSLECIKEIQLQLWKMPM